MTDADDTPNERPCANPANARIANELAGVRHAVSRWTRQLGDIERTIRIVTVEAGADVRRRVGANIAGIGLDLVDAGTKIQKEATG